MELSTTLRVQSKKLNHLTSIFITACYIGIDTNRYFTLYTDYSQTHGCPRSDKTIRESCITARHTFVLGCSCHQLHQQKQLQQHRDQPASLKMCRAGRMVSWRYRSSLLGKRVVRTQHLPCRWGEKQHGRLPFKAATSPGCRSQSRGHTFQ